MTGWVGTSSAHDVVAVEQKEKKEKREYTALYSLSSVLHATPRSVALLTLVRDKPQLSTVRAASQCQRILKRKRR